MWVYLHFYDFVVVKFCFVSVIYAVAVVAVPIALDSVNVLRAFVTYLLLL